MSLNESKDKGDEATSTIEVVLAGGISLNALAQPDARLTTTKWELAAYYLYYVGNSGLGPFNFAPTQFQNLLSLAGSNLDQPGVACDYSVPCVLPFGGMQQRDINSIVLVTNGISFAIQVVLFLAIGSYADYGGKDGRGWRPYILISFTVISIAINFGWLGVEDPSQWRIATGLYIVGLIAYQGALTFWTAAFPGLARALPEMQESQTKLISGETTAEAHNTLDSLSRNRLSNISFAVSSAGEFLILAVMVGILYGIHSSDSVEQNTMALSVVTAFSGGVWLLCALPWFTLEKHRPGISLPVGETYWTIGYKTVWLALKQVYKITDMLLYLIFFFLMSDCLNTTVTVISTIQYTIVSYNTLQLTYLLMVGIFTQGVGIYAFWWVQKRFAISTKNMLIFNCFWIMVLVAWGMIGASRSDFGFKNLWEIWAYQAFYGLLVCPWYSYSQTMISEVVPVGYEYLFFALFSITGKTSAFIGPFVTSAITAQTNNPNESFYFLFALGAVACAILPFIDIGRNRVQCRAFLAEQDQIKEVVEVEVEGGKVDEKKEL